MELTDRTIDSYNTELHSKLTSIVMLLDYRYKLLLVKAAPEQMLPVEVEVSEGVTCNMEEVATLGITADDQFTVFATDQLMIPKIQTAIAKRYPLIKQEIETPDASDDDEVSMMMAAAEKMLGHKPEPVKSIVMTLPEMNKDRRKLTNEAVDALKKQCEVLFKKYLSEDTMLLTSKVGVFEPDRVKEASDKLQAKHDECWKTVEEKVEQYHKEIEERYNAYVAAHPESVDVSEMTEQERVSAGMSMRLGSDYEE